MTDQFNPNQLDILRIECAKITRIDPSSPTYQRMIELLNSMPVRGLRQVRDANIKFLSKLAANRIPA